MPVATVSAGGPVLAHHELAKSTNFADLSLPVSGLHQHVTTPQLIEIINANREQGNLSSAIRLFVLELYQDQIDRVALRPPEPSKSSVKRRRTGGLGARTAARPVKRRRGR